MRCFHLLLLLISTITPSIAQNSTGMFTVNITYAGQLSGGDLADDFSNNLNIGGGIQYMTKNNWIFGVEANTMFGGNIKKDVLANMRTVEGEIINGDQTFAIVFLEGRGFYGGLIGGKLINVVKKFPKSGIRLTASTGILQHKIRIEDRTGSLTQLQGEYLKGYDRLTNGFMTYQFLGYQLLDPKKRLDFFVGVDFLQGYTQNRRSWNWDTRERDTRKRQDFQLGIKAGIIIPLYKKDKSEELFFED